MSVDVVIDNQTVVVLVAAFAIDIIAGDPPNRFHPVAWMGSGIACYRRRFNLGSNARRFVSGSILILVGIVGVVGIGWLIQLGCREIPIIFSVVIQACLLKSTFSARTLVQAAKSVAAALDADDIGLARQQVAFHLVSRDTSTLDSSALAAATIESVAENSSDSIVAPLFFFVIAGLPGALAYRLVNTCDAMLGYRTFELEWFGKAAARLDDLLNFVPSRITAILMFAGSPVTGTVSCLPKAIVVWWRDHALTASPNAGHPMSAAAGILGVRLEKHEHYRLGAELPSPTNVSISHSIRLLWTTAIAAVLLFGAFAWIREVLL